MRASVPRQQRHTRWERPGEILYRWRPDRECARLSVALAQRRRSHTTIDELGIVRGEVADAIREERINRL